jgi:hypothetical protein
VPSSPSSPSITGFDGDNQSATSDDVADKAHGHRWHLHSSPSANVADKPRGHCSLKVKHYAQSHFPSSPPLGTLSTLPPPFLPARWMIMPMVNAFVNAVRLPSAMVHQLIKVEKSLLMKQEKAAFCKMLDCWLLRNNNNWLYGVHIIQAVTNTMPL